MKRKQLKFMKGGRNNDTIIVFIAKYFFYKLQDFQNIETNHRVDIDRYWEQQASRDKMGLFVYVFFSSGENIYPSFISVM